jgi:hypothetical protein
MEEPATDERIEELKTLCSYQRGTFTVGVPTIMSLIARIEHELDRVEIWKTRHGLRVNELKALRTGEEVK